jgi:uncharacterized lipoprotein YmbA
MRDPRIGSHWRPLLLRRLPMMPSVMRPMTRPMTLPITLPISLPMVLSVLMLLAGCASSPPSRFYTLTALPEAQGRVSDVSDGQLAVGIGPVVFPQFLDRPQLVLRDGSNRLGVEEFERWGGSLQDDFLRVWGQNLGHLLNTSRILIFPSESRMPLDFRITAEVISFEARQGGDALLKVRWAVMDPRLEQSLASRDDVYRCPVIAMSEAATASAAPAVASGRSNHLLAPIAEQDSEAVVAAMSQCLGRFSRDVAEVLKALPKPLPPSPEPSGF